MRILIINDYIKKSGGAETFIHTLKDVLEKRGNEIEIFGFNGGEDTYSLFSRWYSLKWYRRTVQKIREFKPDVVHINNCSRVLSPSVIKAANKMKVPVVITLHDYHYFCPKNWAIDNKGFECQVGFSGKCLYSNCPGNNSGLKRYPVLLMKFLRLFIHRNILKRKGLVYVSPSISLAKKMEKSLLIKVKVIPNGLFLTNSKTKYEKEIIFVGELCDGKGLQTIIEVLNKIKGYKVSILGEGPLKEVLEKKYKKINFVGFQNPEKYYKRASIAIVPPIWVENFPYSVIEAMNYGLVVVATDRGGISEQIDDSKTGFLFNAGDSKDFSKKINYLLKNPSEIKRVGKNAKEVTKKYSWDKIAKEYEKLYLEIT
jgi:glycosyltransferase involved in cell wall biosynthesis